MSTKTIAGPADLLRVRRGAVDLVDVPEFGFATVTGRGSPDSAEFGEAVQALFAVGYGAHFLVKKASGAATRVMPLEAQWWVDDPDQAALMRDLAAGDAAVGADKSQWRWRAMMQQPDPIDADVVAAAVEQARAKKLPGLDRVEYVRWAEGRCAQLLHVGPYADEGPSIVRLHAAIAEAGCRPRGRHHEIYLSDPRRCAPAALKTLLRQPVEPSG